MILFDTSVTTYVVLSPAAVEAGVDTFTDDDLKMSVVSTKILSPPMMQVHISLLPVFAYVTISLCLSM